MSNKPPPSPRSGSRRRLLLCGLTTMGLISPLGRLADAAARVEIEVWKTPSCGCCKDWIAHLQAEGFTVKTHEIGDYAKRDIRRRLGLHDRYGSCHTALVAGYVVEGHVPAREIRRLLTEKPAALGLAVPGMPIGSPGMDGPAYGGRKDPYEVLLIQRNGDHDVYQRY